MRLIKQALRVIIYIVIEEKCNAPEVQVKIFSDSYFSEFATKPMVENIINFSGVDLKLTLFVEGSWRRIDNNGNWSPRDGAGVVVLRGSIYLLGGWNYTTVVSEVWKSEDLQHWIRLPDAPWEPRHGAGWLVHDEKIYVIGGDLIDDVWSSSDGIQWSLNSESAPFGKRYTPIVHSANGYMYLYGGQYWMPEPWCTMRADCSAVGMNDVWRSKDGSNWQIVTGGAPWAGRGLIHGGLFFRNSAFIVGGGLKNAAGQSWMETSFESSDIWSSEDGLNWIKRANSLGFPPRTHVSVLSTEQGCFIQGGSVGNQSNLSNNMFYASDCINFEEIEVPQNMQKRHAASLFEFNGSVVVLGGPPTPGGGAGTTIWQYFPKIRS